MCVCVCVCVWVHWQIMGISGLLKKTNYKKFLHLFLNNGNKRKKDQMCE